MSEYNNISRSRSKERHFEEYYENERFHNKSKENKEHNKTREEYNDRIYNSYKILERLKEENYIKEKERNIEIQNFLRRENELLREIIKISNQNNSNNKPFQKFNKPYNTKFSNFPQNKYNNTNNPKEKVNEEKNNSLLDKFISNMNKSNNYRNNIYNNKIQKYKKKIYLPNNPGINLVGLLIGPKGIFQRLLEKQSGCKIYINGKNIGKREKYISPNDNDEANVLIIGDSEEKMKRGVKLVEDIIFADEDAKNKIISEQLKVSKQEGLDSLNFWGKNNEFNSNDYLMTKDGPPEKNSRYYKAPNDCINSIIGRDGETIRKIELESNCKIKIGKAPIPNTKMRYIFIEGSEENYQIAKGLIEKIIGEYVNNNINNID
jgi:hypothetical protein